jgi:hypothetical protein
VDVSHARASYERGIVKVVLPITERRAAGERVSIEVTRS